MSDLTTPAAPAPPRPVGKRLVYWVKLVMTVAVVACIAYQLYVNVKALRAQTFHIHWRNIALSAAAFAAFMV